MWKVIDDTTPEAWDELLASSGGHPLQTALWGEARANAEGTESERLLVQQDGRTVLLARVEMRRRKLVGKIAWLPQGPMYLDAQAAFDAHVRLKAELKARGYHLLFENPYVAEPPRYREHGVPMGEPTQTIITDLSMGENAVWNKVSSNWRNNVRTAERKGICVSEAYDADSVRQFVAACERLSDTKGFRYQGSEALISRLLRGTNARRVFAKLYCATLANRFIGGLCVMTVGTTMQNIFSAAVRGEQSAGRLLQWTAMKSAVNAKVTRYDLGGVDPVANPGGYEFKRQIRGELVTVAPVRGSALSPRGGAALWAARALRRI